MSNETLELAKALLARASVTPADQGCQQLIIDRLAPLGFSAETFRCGEVTNLWIRHGVAAPLVVLAGHTDVVPPGPLDQWHTDPFVPTLKDGKLHARGAADMKASIAAFVVAAGRLVAAHPDHPGSLALLITSDEEGDAVDGTVRVVEALKARGERIDYCIVGEPTCAERFGDTIKNGRRGSLTGRLTVRGIQGHVAYPHLARNPVHGLAPVLAEFAALEWDKGNESFPPTTWQVSNIHAGTGAQNIIPGEAKVDFNFRFSTASTIEGLKARVHAVLDRHALDYHVEWIVGGRPFLTPRGRLVETLKRVVRQVSGVTPGVSTTGGTSDGRFIADICPEVVEFGPVNRSIHKVNEAVSVDELEPLADVFRLACGELLGVR
ncbi:MAG: succinyl-diaminopimelate desuccinylase [Betaproteobacteria bacterium]|nr:succinyl-diaminopimelate desuccinylase [Betaproteobacteria bacterium]